MARVEHPSTAAARILQPAPARDPAGRSGASRAERPGFSLPDLQDHAARRPARRPDDVPVRSRDIPARTETDRSPRRDAPERSQDRHDARSRPVDRASEKREARESRDADDDRQQDASAAPVPDAGRGTTDVAQAEGEVAEASAETHDRPAAETPNPATGADVAATATPAAPVQPGIVVAALALPVPGAPSQATGASDAAAAGKGKVSGIRAHGQKADAPAKSGAADTSSNAGEAAGEADRKPAIPAVAALLGRRDDTDKGGSETPDGLLTGLIDGTKDGAAGQAGGTAGPAFADLLGQAAGIDPKASATAHRAIVTDVAIGRVPIEIGLKALDGTNQFAIKLSPDELGRVDVKLDIDSSGQVKAHLIVERPEALALLTRDRGQLEQALEQAGLKPSDGGISFSLRDGSPDGGGRFMQGGDGQRHAGSGRQAGPDEGVPQGPAPVLPRAILSRLGALDMRI